MECHDACELMELAVLDAQRASQDEGLAAHLAACPACRAAEARLRRLLDELRAVTPETPASPRFERTLRLALAGEHDAQREHRRARRLHTLVASVAAIVLVAFGAWHIVPHGAPTPPSAIRAPAQPGREHPPPSLSDVNHKWQYARAHAVPTSPADRVVIHGSRMYVLREESSSSHLAAISLATGTTLWHAAAESCGYVVADDARVYCLSARGREGLDLLALDADTGRLLWRHTGAALRRTELPCRPVALDGRHVCWTTNCTVHLLDGAMGHVVWRRDLAVQGQVSRAVRSGRDICVATARHVHALSIASGDVCWTTELDGDGTPHGRPILATANGKLYLAQPSLGRGTRLTCLDVATHRPLWHRTLRHVRSLMADDQQVYVRGQGVLALDTSTGRERWRRDAEGCGPLTLVGGLLHFVDMGDHGRLVALDHRTGKTAWQLPGIRSCDAFAQVGHTAYIKTQDGVVHAFQLPPDRL